LNVRSKSDYTAMSDQLQGERRKLTARYEALMTSTRRLTQQR